MVAAFPGFDRPFFNRPAERARRHVPEADAQLRETQGRQDEIVQALVKGFAQRVFGYVGFADHADHRRQTPALLAFAQTQAEPVPGGVTQQNDARLAVSGLVPLYFARAQVLDGLPYVRLRRAARILQEPDSMGCFRHGLRSIERNPIMLSFSACGCKAAARCGKSAAFSRIRAFLFNAASRHAKCISLAPQVDSSTETAGVMRHILLHLLEHPAARDTVEGIHLWWLNRRYVLPLVERGVEELVERGWLQCYEMASGVCIYGLNESATAEVRAFADQGGTTWPT